MRIWHLEGSLGVDRLGDEERGREEGSLAGQAQLKDPFSVQRGTARGRARQHYRICGLHKAEARGENGHDAGVQGWLIGL